MIRDKFWLRKGQWNDEELGVICINCGLRFGSHTPSSQYYDQCKNKITKWKAPSEATPDDIEWAKSLRKWRKALNVES